MALVKRSPLIGYGTGDEIAMLKTQYIQKGLYISYLEDFNAHNQYLSFLLKNGVLGLAIFLMAFVYYLRLAFLNRDFMYISFLILLLIGFYTENVLDANKGILFFTFFNTLFGYEALKSLKMKGKTK
jgi:O-antigen ligase